jgi:hypothetical protein
MDFGLVDRDDVDLKGSIPDGLQHGSAEAGITVRSLRFNSSWQAEPCLHALYHALQLYFGVCGQETDNEVAAAPVGKPKVT